MNGFRRVTVGHPDPGAGGEEQRRVDPNARYAQALPAAVGRRYVRALFGAGQAGQRVRIRVAGGVTLGRAADGCLAEAERGLYGDLTIWSTATVRADQVAAGIPARVLADPRYLRAQASWAACMRRSGLPVRSPAEARERAAAATGSHADRRAAAVRLATAEADCARQTGFGPVASTVDSQLRAALGPTERAAVDRKRALQRQALPRARAVLAR